MASPGGRAYAPLTDRLRRDFGHFNYYQLVRLLLAERRRHDRAAPGLPKRERRHGLRRRELDHGIRFRADLNAAFPGVEVSALTDIPVADEQDEPATRAELATTNYCIAGYQGPLPETYTEWLRDQVREGKRGMAAFLDLFNHRINVLRYEIKARHRPGLDPQPPESMPQADHLAALIGFADRRLAGVLPIPLRGLLGVAGLLANRRRSPPVVVGILKAYLQVPVRLEPLRGAWRRLDAAQHSVLGRTNCRLGIDSIVGGRIWDSQARVRIVAGPMDHARFQTLLPGGDAHDKLAALVRYLLDRRYDCEFRLLVRTDTLPRPELGRQRLAHSAWLAGRQDANPEDVASAVDAVRRIDLLLPAFEPEAA